MHAHLTAFLAVDLVLILVPGPDFALVSRNTLRGGRRAGMLTALGANLGLVGWGIAAVLGLATLLAASAAAYSIVKLAGAVYLIVLGAQTLWRAWKHHSSVRHNQSAASSSSLAVFRQGLVNSLLNPKSAVLYTSLLPQFIPSHAAVLPNLALLAAINTVLALAWFCLCAATLDWLNAHLKRAMRWIERISGILLIALGLRIATEPR